MDAHAARAFCSCLEEASWLNGSPRSGPQEGRRSSCPRSAIAVGGETFRQLETHGPRSTTRRTAQSSTAPTITSKLLLKQALQVSKLRVLLQQRIMRLYRDRLPGLLKHLDRQRATPCWVTRETLLPYYQAVRLWNKRSGVIWALEHEVPLKHALVCGLHCPANIHLVPLDVWLSRIEPHWDDMP